jgi:predicted MPP superfamily phosphohydrolase
LHVLLAHSPDQFKWARRRDFDLMLAGHTHGGQICLPVIGPIHCPSWHGVKYASGVFFEPPTVMHVSRGVSSELPIRLNCRPEVTKLVLRGTRMNG